MNDQYIGTIISIETEGRNYNITLVRHNAFIRWAKHCKAKLLRRGKLLLKKKIHVQNNR